MLWVIKLKFAKTKNKNINYNFNLNYKYLNNKNIKNKRYFSKFAVQSLDTNLLLPLHLNPWFVTGFTDAEGCFNISVSKRKNTNRYEVQARFIIEVHIKEMDLLLKIQSFFGGVGQISSILNKNACRYSVVGIKDINNFIVPHFIEYPLQSAKRIDFDLWLQCINLLNDKKHLTVDGLIQIVSLKSIMNLGLSNKLKLEFSNLKDLKRQEYTPNNENLDPYWISGFIEGDGSFYIIVKPAKHFVYPYISIGLNAREILLLKKIQEYFNGKGGIYSSKDNTKVVEWKVSKLSDVIYISSHFKSYPLVSFKSTKFLIWKKILSLVKTKSHLTQNGLNQIQILNYKLKN